MLVFVSKHLMNFETPHPTSSLGHLLPKGEGKVFPTLCRGERVSRCIGTGEGSVDQFGLRPQAAPRLRGGPFPRGRNLPHPGAIK